MARLVLDTTYLLPFFGVAVRGVDERRIAALRRRHELFYPVLMLPELWAKVLREAERRGILGVPAQAIEGLQALLAQADVRLAEPTPRQLLVAAELRLAGHRDLFDCLGYGCAVAIGGKFLSEDKSLKRFLERLGRRDLNPEIVISAGDLQA